MKDSIEEVLSTGVKNRDIALLKQARDKIAELERTKLITSMYKFLFHDKQWPKIEDDNFKEMVAMFSEEKEDRDLFPADPSKVDIDDYIVVSCEALRTHAINHAFKIVKNPTPKM